MCLKGLEIAPEMPWSTFQEPFVVRLGLSESPCGKYRLNYRIKEAMIKVRWIIIERGRKGEVKRGAGRGTKRERERGGVEAERE